MYVLGISCYYHDSAAALLRDGELVAAADEERFSRIKHDSGYPAQAIAFCLNQAGITASELDYVVFYEKPLLKFERLLMSILGGFPRTLTTFREGMLAWFEDKLWIKSKILSELELPANKMLFVEHHLAHGASAMFASPFDSAAVLTVDGVGEWATATVGRGTATWGSEGKNQLEILSEIHFPHSLGLLYSAFTAFLGFRVNNGEYKVMGMAPYGEPRYVDDVYKLIEVGTDGSFRLKMEYFDFHRSIERTYSQNFLDLFGETRVHDADFFTPLSDPERSQRESEQARINQRYADIAASIQRVTEDVMLKMVDHVHKVTGEKRLCMAGGVALNSVANGRIVREGPFEEVFIQPAAGDSGGALGAALYAYHVLLGKPRKFVQQHNYWGQAYSADEVRAFLDKNSIAYEYVTDDDKLLDMTTEALVKSQVVGWFQGRFEWGPRALGHRSILADPTRAEMKEIVNVKIKFREPFRPFAPVVLEERANEYFGLGDLSKNHLAQYMLMVAPIPPEKHSEIPAVTHVNGSGRLQSIREEINPWYYQLVKRFGEATGIPVLLNTSFNLRGEPIVNTPENAFNTFIKSDIDLLVIDRFVVRKSK